MPGKSGSVASVAHRGYSSLYPENTLLSFERAIAAGCDMIELDIQLTADGEIVVIHDYSLERTTDGSGEVHEKTLEELKRLDAGSWRGERFEGRRIPTLREVLDLARGRIGLLVEIKARGDPAFREINRRLCGTLAGLLSREAEREACVIASFNEKCLDLLKEILPGWERALIRTAAGNLGTVARLGRGLAIHRKSVDAPLVEEAHRRGLWVCPWTVDDADEIRRLVSLGVDAIAGNDAETLTSVLSGEPRRNESDAQRKRGRR